MYLTSTGTKRGQNVGAPNGIWVLKKTMLLLFVSPKVGDNTRILQSPLSVNTPDLFTSLRAGQADQLCNIGYTLISYDYGAFTGDTTDLNLKVFHGLDKKRSSFKSYLVSY